MNTKKAVLKNAQKLERDQQKTIKGGNNTEELICYFCPASGEWEKVCIYGEREIVLESFNNMGCFEKDPS